MTSSSPARAPLPLRRPTSARWPTGLVAGGLLVALAACSGDAPSPLRTAAVGRQTVSEVVEAPATVAARATATVRAPADGRLAELRVREGQHVRAGQLLARVDSPSAEQALREARDADDQARRAGDVPVPRVGLARQQARARTSADAGFAAARRAAAQIQDPRVRAQTLAGLAQAQGQYAAAQDQVSAAVRQVDAGLGSVGTAVASLSSAQRVQTRAAVDAARRVVDSLDLRSPVAGTVSLGTGSGGGTSSAPSGLTGLPAGAQDQARALLGAGGSGAGSSTVSGVVAAGSPVRSGGQLMTVTDASALSLVADVDETDVLLVRPGVAATAELDAVPGATYTARVSSIDATPTTSGRGGVSYVVRLALEGGEDAAGHRSPVPRPGMSAVTRLQVRTARDAVAVPASAVVHDGDRNAVWVVEGSGDAAVARRRYVSVGAQGEDAVQVTGGLRAGARIVVHGADRLRDGQRLS